MGSWVLGQLISLGFDPEFAETLSHQDLSQRDMWRVADLRAAIIVRYGGPERAAMFNELDEEGRTKLQAQLDKLDRDGKLRDKLDPIAPRDQNAGREPVAPEDDELLRAAKELGIDLENKQ